MAKLEQQQKGPTTPKSQLLTVITLFPIGGFLLLLAGITLTGTIIGITVATPLFIIFSPVIIPVALTVGLTLTGFMASGVFGFTAVSSFSWIVNQLKKRRVLGTDGQMG